MITAAADGSALSNPGPAGWAWYVDDQHWAAGGWSHGTNNMGELMAVLDLLWQTAEVDEPLHVLCDSQYAINCISKWTPGWKRRGWKKADGKPVLNVELLKQLDEALQGRRVSFEWVKGHAGHTMNEKADELARAAATAFRDGAALAHGPGFSGAAPRPAPDVEVGQREPEPDLFAVVDLDQDEANEGAHPLVTVLSEHTRALLDNEVRNDAERLGELLHPELVRHDSAGAVHTRGALLHRGLGRLDLSPSIEVLGLENLADDLVLMRWRLGLGSRRHLVASVWARESGLWRLRFEQVTPVAAIG